MEKAPAFAAYLDSIQRDYPYGIPRSALRPAARTQVLFVGEVPGAAAGDPYQGPAGELLKAAITKGMKLALGDVAVALPPFEGGAGALAARVAEMRPRCVVCLGKAGCEALSESVKGQNVPEIIVTQDLNAVLAGAEAKRTFWEDLKKAMALLR